MIDNRIFRRRPNGIEGVRSLGAHRVLRSVLVDRFAARFNRPARKDIPRARERVGRKARAFVRRNLLRRHRPLAAVRVEDNLVDIRRPNGVEGVRAFRAHRIGRAVRENGFAVRFNRPARKGVPRARKCVGGKSRACVRRYLLRRHRPFAAVRVEDNLIDVCVPFCRYRSALFGRPRLQARARFVRQPRFSAVPAAERIPRAHGNGEGIGSPERHVLLRSRIAPGGAVILEQDAQAEIDRRRAPALPILRPLGGDTVAVSDDNRRQRFTGAERRTADKIDGVRNRNFRKSGAGERAGADIFQPVREGEIRKSGAAFKGAVADGKEPAGRLRKGAGRRLFSLGDGNLRQSGTAAEGVLPDALDAARQNYPPYLRMPGKGTFPDGEDGFPCIRFGENERLLRPIKFARRHGVPVAIILV